MSLRPRQFVQIYLLALTITCLAASSNSLQAATVTFSNIQQSRNPAGPLGVPDDSLPNQLRLPTPVYAAQDDGVIMVDQDNASFTFGFDVAVDPNAIATTAAIRQNFSFDFGAPGEASNFVRTGTKGTIRYREINGVPVDPSDIANQQAFALDQTFFGSDLPGPGMIDMLIPLAAGVTDFDVEFENTLTAFSVEDNAIIEGRDIRFAVITTTVPEPGAAALGGLGLVLSMGFARRSNNC